MGAESTKDKKRKRYVAHSKSVKKGSYPLRPGVQGFFITCDGGRERQASQEAINVIDTFYEQLVDEEEDLGVKHTVIPKKPMNKVIKFSYSDSSSDDEESGKPKEADTNRTNQPNESVEATTKEQEVEANEKQDEVDTEAKQVEDVNHEDQENEAETSPKKQRLQTDVPECKGVLNDEPEKKAVVHDEPEKKVVVSDEPEKKSIDKQIEDELKELKDRSKRRFVSLDPGCNGVAFVQMLKRNGDPSPAEIVKHMMTTVAATRKHMSRFILRLLPVELTCYASEEEISKAIKPLMDQYFPAEAQTPLKFAVLYESRANTGIDRMSIINAVAKSVPAPHKVDLNNPDKSIVVQIAKTVCSIGVVEKYKELSKYNLRQLTSPVG